jgi:hypothetical protein
MKTSEALQIIGGLSNTKKMDCFSYGLPALECKTGSKLRLVPGSTCYNCYALKGCYVFPVVKEAQYRRLQATKGPQWVQAMAVAINSKRSDWFRWHDSGDVQDLDHLNKIFEVCELTPSKRHWLPTREAWIRDHAKRFPKNLIVRLSMPMVDQTPAGSWSNTSTVVTAGASCPAPLQGGKCNDCRNCWNKKISNVSYGKH